MISLSRATGALILGPVLVLALLAALPAGAVAAQPFKLASAPIACSYDGTTLHAVSVAAPRAAMEATWRRPRGGHAFAAQYVYLVLQLQAEHGPTWRTVATTKRYTKVGAKLHAVRVPALPRPVGGTSYRVLQTLRWIKPTSKTQADKRKTSLIPGTCPASAPVPSMPTSTPISTPNEPPPACPTWDGNGGYTAPGWIGGTYTLTMTSTTSDSQTSAGWETRTVTVAATGAAGSFAVNTNAWSTGEPVTISVDPVIITYGSTSATERCPPSTFSEVGTD